MNTLKDKLVARLKELDEQLVAWREAFDAADANDVHGVIKARIEIAKIQAQIEEVENALKFLNGV